MWGAHYDERIGQVHSCRASSGPSTAGIMTIFYRLKFETLATWRARYLYLFPQELSGQLYRQTLDGIS
jgi:hypothetical protein